MRKKEPLGIVVSIPRDLHKRLKMLSASRQIPLRELVEDALNHYLEKEQWNESVSTTQH